MIKQPEPETRNVNNLFYASEQRRIDKLNQKFFQNIELTEKENAVLVWLCGWDDVIFNEMINIFQKVRG